MHPRNRYRDKHDFQELIRLEPRLADYIITTPSGAVSLNFSERTALLLLNRTLLRRDYRLRHWDLPDGHLVPPLPGRLDYIHTLADLTGSPERVLDIGTGASLIYPILGTMEYGWEFVATDISDRAVKVATAIATMNKPLKKRIALRQQADPAHVFRGVVLPGERFGATMCNPPFYESRQAAEAAGRKKWSKLGREDTGLSFGGSDSELWTPGGERRFLRDMIRESVEFRSQIGWFTTLVSKRGYLDAVRRELDRVGADEVRVLNMQQGNKQSRVLAWQFT
ncbi:MAG: 23S rRNA (adenine(1618)-N(6))-methyltransferase RlmF [Lewinella sp.]